MRLHPVTAMIAGAALAVGGAAAAQTALGNSMGSDSSASATSTSSQRASGAHGTPVAKAARHQSGGHARRSSTSGSAGGANGSGDMTPSANANPTNQH